MHRTSHKVTLTRMIVPSHLTHLGRTIPLRYLAESSLPHHQHMRCLVEDSFGDKIPRPAPPSPLIYSDILDDSVHPDHILRSIDEDPIFAQATLPMKMGGLNLHSLRDTADPGYVASWTLCASNPRPLPQYFQEFLLQIPNTTPFPEGSHLAHFYTALSRILYLGHNYKHGKALYQRLFEDLSIAEFNPTAQRLQLSQIQAILQGHSITSISKVLNRVSIDSKLQHFLSLVINDAKFARLVRRVSLPDAEGSFGGLVDQARLHALCIDGSSAFLQMSL